MLPTEREPWPEGRQAVSVRAQLQKLCPAEQNRLGGEQADKLLIVAADSESLGFPRREAASLRQVYSPSPASAAGAILCFVKRILQFWSQAFTETGAAPSCSFN